MSLAWFFEEACRFAKISEEKAIKLSQEEQIELLRKWHANILTTQKDYDPSWVPPPLDYYIKVANFKPIVKEDKKPTVPIDQSAFVDKLKRENDALRKKLMAAEGHTCLVLGKCSGGCRS
jgi:hypothetical protein